MVSLQILAENPLLLGENLIPMSSAGKHFPVSVQRSTVERWVRRGVAGAKLETVRVGGKRFTSLEAITRFLHAQQLQGHQPVTTPKPSMTKAELEAGRKRYGLPDPQEPSLN